MAELTPMMKQYLEIKMDKLELNNVIWYNSNKYIVGGILWHHRK